MAPRRLPRPLARLWRTLSLGRRQTPPTDSSTTAESHELQPWAAPSVAQLRSTRQDLHKPRVSEYIGGDVIEYFKAQPADQWPAIVSSPATEAARTAIYQSTPALGAIGYIVVLATEIVNHQRWRSTNVGNDPVRAIL